MAALLRLNPFSILYHLIKNDMHRLEYDPKMQLRVNIVMARFWFLNIFAVIGIDIFINPFWQRISIVYLALVSIYANMVTHYAGIPASYAAVRSDEIKHQTKKVEEQVMSKPTVSGLEELPLFAIE